MIDDVARAVSIDASRFLFHGFSGGGQFAHRFFILHPDRLLGLSIGAPGSVTLLEDERAWWVGVRDLSVKFGVPPNYGAMRHVPVQMVVGDEDNETITIEPWERRWMDGANDAGVTRVARLASLRASFERRGIAVQHDVVPGIGHEGIKLIGPVETFFAEILKRRSDQTRQPSPDEPSR